MSYNPYRVCVGCPERGTAYCSRCRADVERAAEEYGDEMAERGDAARKER